MLDRQIELIDSSDRTLIHGETSFAAIPRAIHRRCGRRASTARYRGSAGEQGGGGFALDITDLERAREALTRQMDAHVRTLDELPTAVVMFDPRQQLTYSNKAFRDLFALDAAYLATQPTNGEILDRLRLNGVCRKLRITRPGRRAPRPVYERRKRHACLDPAEWPALRVVISPNPQGGVTYLFEDETERFTLAASYDRLKDAQWKR